MHTTPKFLIATIPLLAVLGIGRVDDTATIKQESKDFIDAWNKHEPISMADFFAKDGDLIDPMGAAASGRREVERYFTEQHHGGPLAKTFYDLKKDSVRMLTPDVALEDWEATISGLPGADGQPSGPMLQRVFIVRKKDKDKWPIAAARVSSPEPREVHKPVVPMRK